MGQYKISNKFHLLNSLFIVAIFIILWNLVISSRANSLLIPSVPSVLNALVTILTNQNSYYQIYITIFRSLTGFFLAFICSLILGILMWYSKPVKSFIHDLGIFTQAVSILVWILFLIVIFGVISDWPAILVPFFISFPIIANNIETGIENVDHKLVEMAHSFQASGDEVYLEIIMPSLKPYLYSAVRSGISLSLKVSVVAEAYSGGNGIGYQIIYNYNQFNQQLAIAWAILIVVIMIVIDWVILGKIGSTEYTSIST